MHLGQHLTKSPSGIYHFRLRIPRACQPYYQNRTEIKKSLGTRRKRVAQPLANRLYERNMTVLKNIYLEIGNAKVTIDQATPEMEMKTAQGILGNVSKVTNQTAEKNLSGLIEQYLEDTKGSVTPRTQTERKGALSAYLSISYTFDHESANRFSDTLKKLPPGFKKDNIIELSKQIHEKVISAKTHNKYIGFLSAFNNWLVKRGETDKNYFSGLMMTKTKQAHLERDPFTPDEITKLLNESGKLTGFKHWLPRLGLYTGCRLNELSQLYLEDIITVDGILSLRIASGLEGQHLKNLSSERTVPIHPDLVDDFNEYLSTLTGDRVFPELTWTKASYWGGLSSKWFGRFKKSIQLDKTFHSLRHTFASNLQEQEVDSRIIGELLGHSVPGETSRYTGRRPVSQLMDAIKCLKF